MEGAGDYVQKLLVALGHPTRRRILREMDGRPPVSPRQISEKLDETLSNVSYHFRVLADSGVLELVSTRPVRGSTQHFYDASIEADWAQALLAAEVGPPANGDGRGKKSPDDALRRRRVVGPMDEIEGTAGDDARVEAAVLRQILLLHPTQITLEELVREVAADPETFAERDAIERAAGDLARTGLVHRSGEFVLPSRAALRFGELLGPA